MEKIVEIRAEHEGAAIAKLEKLARRGLKYGQAIAWRAEPFVEERKRVRWDGKPVLVEIPMVRFHVSGEAPRVGEFKFIAQLELSPGGVLVAGGEVGALGYDWAGECQHCNSKRARKLGYVVEDADGARKIVGKSCLRDHLGHDCPAGALWIFQFEREVAGFPMEEGWGGAGRWEESIIGVVAAARAAIALYGWANARSEGMSSADAVSAALSPLPLKGERAKVRDAIRAELKARGDHYEAVAQLVLDWGAALQPRGDYEHNLKVALACPAVDDRRFNLVVSAAAAYDAQVAREAERAAKAKAVEAEGPGFHVGVVGERMESDLILERKIALPDRGFGPSVIYRFRNEAGAKFSWISGSAPRWKGKPLEVGDAFRAKFMVKAHAEFNGKLENKINRVAIL